MRLPPARAVAAAALLALGARWAYVWATPLPERGSGGGGLRGVYHVHTTRSDGRGTADEIAAAAAADGLDFVVVTDHNVTPRAPEYRDGVLLVYGDEQSAAAGHRVLLPGSGRTYVFWAHPGNRRVPWTDWSAPADGLEIASADDMWRDALRPPWLRLARAAIDFPAAPIEATLQLAEREGRVLDRYDDLVAQRGRLSALCAVDAHGLPPYRTAFALLQLHLPDFRLRHDAAADALALADALAGGRFYCGLDGFADASGLTLSREGAGLRVELPSAPPQARAALVCGGRETVFSLPAVLPAWSGCRLEVRRPDLAARFPRTGGSWIYTGAL